MRRGMNNAYGASGATIGGSGSVPNNGGSGSRGNPVRRAAGIVLDPTTTFLVLLVIAEYATLIALRRTFKHAHGG